MIDPDDVAADLTACRSRPPPRTTNRPDPGLTFITPYAGRVAGTMPETDYGQHNRPIIERGTGLVWTTGGLTHVRGVWLDEDGNPQVRITDVRLTDTGDDVERQTRAITPEDIYHRIDRGELAGVDT